jgi:hypothetical protein
VVAEAVVDNQVVNQVEMVEMVVAVPVVQIQVQEQLEQ